jgi:3-phenylpropionate/cinnamic acid dioxygenase small subunit
MDDAEDLQTSQAEETIVGAVKVDPCDPLYSIVTSFFADEACLLDERRFDEWRALLADDMRYAMPVRPTLSLRSGAYDETWTSLCERLRRAALPTAWGEEPPARTRRFISNLRLWRDQSQSILARCYVLMSVFRDDQSRPDLVAGERRDILRQHGGSFLIADRLVLLDQATLPSRGLMLPL